MPRFKDEPPVVRVYTICDASKYLIVRNVPEFGCGDELLKLFATYGEVEECKPMDAKDCEQYTDVYWVKFHQFNNARFAKRKLDEFIFIGIRQISYGPQYESLADTKEKLEGRRKEVLLRLNPGRRSKRPTICGPDATNEPLFVSTPTNINRISQPLQYSQRNTIACQKDAPNGNLSALSVVSSDKEYFPTQSMNQTVHLVREKLEKIYSQVSSIQKLGPPRKYGLTTEEESKEHS